MESVPIINWVVWIESRMHRIATQLRYGTSVTVASVVVFAAKHFGSATLLLMDLVTANSRQQAGF